MCASSCHLIFLTADALSPDGNSGTLTHPGGSVQRSRVLAAYRDGITVIGELAAQFTDVSWFSPTPCAEWRAADLAGHLRCVADDYHEYLDDAPVSRLARLMATGASADSLARKLARQNAAELAALPDGPGKEHIDAFIESARAYGRRVYSLWDQPHHSYRGYNVTVGLMTGLACAEWHLHAWDLARTLGKDYRPADPALVLDAWCAGKPELSGGLPIGTAALAGTHAGKDPWDALLGASGRDLRWVRVLVLTPCSRCYAEGYLWNPGRAGISRDCVPVLWGCAGAAGWC